MKPRKDLWNAFVEQTYLDGAPSGPLTGDTLAVKDNVAVAGKPFTAGHPLFADRRATETAPAVAALLKAGATFVGMTQTDAGGFGVTTPQTLNPVAPNLIVGGSSGGSAAAVAAGLCDMAIGTDTGGSVRIPAACTGLAAFKPTYGRVSNDGVWPLMPGLDHVGLIAGDLNLLQRAGLELMESTHTAHGIEAVASLRIGVEADPAGLLDPAIAEELDRIAKALGARGHHVERIAIPSRADIAKAHGVIVLSEAAAIYADCDEKQRDSLGKAAASALRHAENITTEAVDAAWEAARGAAEWMKATLGPLDVLISPTLPVPPPPAGARRVTLGGDAVPVVVAMTLLTSLANLTGNPVVSFPDPGSPATPGTGIQLMGKTNADERLFQFAAVIQRDLQAATALREG